MYRRLRGKWQRALATLLLFMLLMPMQAFAMEGAVYEIFVASFFDGNGDGRGDLAGVTEKLDYILALGAKNLWLMPISPSPSYHKYDVTDYCAVDPEYGSLTDFALLAEACRERDMGLVLDLVVNHTAAQHPWFLIAAQSLLVEPCGSDACTGALLCREHNPYCQYYHFTLGQGQHAVPGAEGWFYQGNFGPHMPDLALEEQAVREEIAQIMAFWLERGATGFRLDAVSHYFEQNTQENIAFLGWLKETGASLDPNCYFVGEAWQDQGSIVQLYESGVDSLFDFPFAGPTGYLITSMRNENGAGLGQKVADWRQQMLAANQSAVNAPFLSNHDMGRISGTLMSKLPQMKLAASIYLLAGGNPYIYYGEELGMTGSGVDENKRLPMLWSTRDRAGMCDPPQGADQEQRLAQGADVQMSDPASLWQHYQKALNIRNQCPEMTRGTLEALDTGFKEVMALRFSQGTGVVEVYHNLGEQETLVRLEAPMEWIGALDGGDGEATLEETQIRLPALSSIVLRRK